MMRPFHEPFEKFRSLYAQQTAAQPKDPNAVVLATATPSGLPSARVVLLKGFSEEGFVVYTNTTSRKGNELMQNPRAALCFYWPALDRQVRVEGEVARVTDDEADVYFNSRPRGSQIGAWASLQSQTLDQRSTLEDRVAGFEKKFNKAVERPKHWSGYRIVPTSIEFWQAQESRLHIRELYKKASDQWSYSLLYP